MWGCRSGFRERTAGGGAAAAAVVLWAGWRVWWRGVAGLSVVVALLVVQTQALAQGAVPGPLEVRPSPAEARWIARHPEVVFGLTREFPPFYVREGGSDRVHGFAVELMARWTERLGLRMSLRHYDSFHELRAALARGEVDAAPFAPIEVGVTDGLPVSRPVFGGNLVVASRRDVADTSAAGGFAGRRVAVEAGGSVEAMLRQRFPQARLQAFAHAEDALRAVASGGADLYIGLQQVAVFHVERLLLANIELRANLGPVALGVIGSAAAAPLVSMLQRVDEALPQELRQRLAQRWLPAGSTRLPLPAASAPLSAPELAWVREHGRLRVGYDPVFAPVTLRGELGDFSGYGADLLRLLTDRSGLSVVQEVAAPFATLYERGRRGELELIVGMGRSVARRQDYDFVGPFLRTPTVLFTRPGEQRRVADSDDIGALRLALLRQHFLLPELRVRHPGLQVLELDRQDQVLAAVAEGSADVGLGNLYVVNGLIEHRFAGKVALSGVVSNGDSELYLGVPRQLPELTRVLTRALESVDASELAVLRARWLAREVPVGPDWGAVLLWVGPVVAGLVLLAVVLWLGLRRLQRAHAGELAARERAEEAVQARGRFLAYLSHEVRGTLGAVGSGAELLRTEADPALRERLLEAIARSSSGLLELLETTLSAERALQGGATLHPQDTDLAAWWHDTLLPLRLSAEVRRLDFVDEGGGPRGHARIDPVRLRQVVQNLAGNALKFTEQGEVRLQALVLEDGGERRLRVSVRDTGPGLSEGDRERLFQPYAQGLEGRRAAQGAGLGLALSAQLVQAMGGHLRCLPAPRGAHFELELPLAG